VDKSAIVQALTFYCGQRATSCKKRLESYKQINADTGTFYRMNGSGTAFSRKKK
jgi:hypothetical protein